MIFCPCQLLTVLLGVLAVNAGAADLSPAQVLLTLLGKENGRLNILEGWRRNSQGAGRKRGKSAKGWK